MWLPRAVLAAILILAALIVDQAGFLQQTNDRLAEARMRLAPRAPTGSFVLVDIDAKSIDAIGRWPWPRSVYADAIDRLRDMQASEIAVDIDLSSASPDDEDAKLEAALTRADDSVILVTFSRRETAGGGSTRIVSSVPIDRFGRHAWLANVNVEQDSDGFIRRFKFAEAGDPVVPTLPTMLSGVVGRAGDSFLIDFSIRAEAIDRLSISDLVAGRIDATRIAGKRVIIGAEAIELRDFFNVPVAGVVSGAMLQVLATETLLLNRALAPQPFAASLVGLGLILVFVVWARVRWPVFLGLAGLLALIVEGAALAIQTHFAVMPKTAVWLLALFMVGVAALVNEIDLQELLVRMWRRRTSDALTILEGVVRDNFAGVIVANENGDILSASEMARSILHLDKNLAGQRTDIIPVVDLRNALSDAILAIEAGQGHDESARATTIQLPAEERIIEYVATPSLLDPAKGGSGGYIACLTFSDVTESRRDQDKIAHLARFDTLTGLLNRNQFIEQTTAGLNDQSRSQGCAIVCFDLDRFQIVNDTLGYDVGDHLIQAMAERVRAVSSDGVVARLGSDEFAVLCHGDRAAMLARAITEKLLAQVHLPFEIDGHRLIVGVSAGICVGRPNDSAVSLLMRANTALMRAKEKGGNTSLVFKPEMMDGVVARQSLEVELWDAFEHGDFELAYQPQFDLQNGQITGAEALLRWRHPKRGFVPPSEFIPLAEAIGLIGPIGEWILKTACHAAKGWSRPIKLAVNVSPLQFSRGDVAGAVAQSLRESGLSAHQLDLEITESLFFEKSDAVDASLEALRKMGVGLVLDDFGTGYSSLGYLRSYRIDKIKIDQSFVRGVPDDRGSVAIVQSVCALAAGLGIRVNAEGIEREEQINLLRLAGCQEGQGFLLGRPHGSASIEALLRRSAALEETKAG